MMELHLIRHAAAEVPHLGLHDTERKLTFKGKDQAKVLRKTLETLEVKYDLVLCSPWRRARETASLLEPVADKLEPCELLAQAPSPELKQLIEELASKYKTVALVGHQPWISELTALLLLGDGSLADKFEFRKSSLYALEWTPDQAFLRFVLPPGVLRRLR
jgi:phosphohistidine phosphatase